MAAIPPSHSARRTAGSPSRLPADQPMRQGLGGLASEERPGRPAPRGPGPRGSWSARPQQQAPPARGRLACHRAGSCPAAAGASRRIPAGAAGGLGAFHGAPHQGSGPGEQLRAAARPGLQLAPDDEVVGIVLVGRRDVRPRIADLPPPAGRRPPASLSGRTPREPRGQKGRIGQGRHPPADDLRSLSCVEQRVGGDRAAAAAPSAAKATSRARRSSCWRSPSGRVMSRSVSSWATVNARSSLRDCRPRTPPRPAAAERRDQARNRGVSGRAAVLVQPQERAIEIEPGKREIVGVAAEEADGEFRREHQPHVRRTAGTCRP